ncbi:hypothetical protein [Albidovulum sp.]|jgi:DNA repair exonuclease SbcCD ATPase subunit|uniref:hypothetical protein n=1 Tax=Albidovulum sp. TaxID=1872424 RepID=UPI0039B932B3
MSDIAELERRISAALARIDAGIEGLAAMPPAAPEPGPTAIRDDAEIARLADELEAERTANAQLTERVRAIKEKQEGVVAGLETKVERLTGQMDAADAEIQRLKRLNEELSEANRALAAAAAAGVAEPELINRSMTSELEAMRAARSAEIAEMNEILAELKPLIGEVA